MVQLGLARRQQYTLCGDSGNVGVLNVGGVAGYSTYISHLQRYSDW
jgi:hypothetical protein